MTMHEATQHVLDQFLWHIADIRTEWVNHECEVMSAEFLRIANTVTAYIDGPDATALLRDLLSVRNNVIMRIAQDI